MAVKETQHATRTTVEEEVEHLIAEHGLKDTGMMTGLALDSDPPPTTDELAAAMEGHVAISITLDS